MKIEWDEPKVPRGNTDGLWTKVKNNLSVLRQTHDGPAPRSPSGSRGNSYSSAPNSSRSRSTSSHPRSSSSSRTTQQSSRSRSAGPGPKPYVTISTNGGPPQAYGPGYGSYVLQTSPVGVSPIGGGGFGGGYAATPPVVYNTSSPSPIYSTGAVLSPRPAPAHRHSHSQVQSHQARPAYTPSPLRSPTASTPTTSSRAVPKRSATTPVLNNNGGGMMYNGKLIVGDPTEVERYVNSQKGIEKWLQNVK